MTQKPGIREIARKMTDEHRTLVDRATAGDPPAIDELLTRHLPRLEAFVRSRRGLLVATHTV